MRTNYVQLLDLPPCEILEHQTTTDGGNSVYKIILCQSQVTTEELMRLTEAGGALDFWNQPKEDIYTPEDGEPVS